jgi:hypothetical protein
MCRCCRPRQARVMNTDTLALLDTGSVVTLLRPDLAGGKEGGPMEVACVHGDTRIYKTCHVVVRTPHGVFTARAGIVPHLPVPLLIGRDCPIFHRLWDPEREGRGGESLPAEGGGELGKPAGPRGSQHLPGSRRQRTRDPTETVPHHRDPRSPQGEEGPPGPAQRPPTTTTQHPHCV